MSRLLSSVGSRVIAGVAMAVLLFGDPTCTCADSPDQLHGTVAERSGGHAGACCPTEASKSGRRHDSSPAQHNPACPHCESLQARNSNREQLDQRTPGPSSPEAFLEAMAFIARKVEIQLDVTRYDLHPPASSLKTLSLLCTLLI